MKLFNNEEFTIITHFDVDGAGGPLLLKHCFPKQVKKVKPCGYNKITPGIEKTFGNVIITDLSLTQDQVNAAAFCFDKVILFDHHETSLGLEYPKEWKVFINTKACATKLIYIWLLHHGFDVKHAEKFVNAVDSYDMWRHDDPVGKFLNNIFWEISFFRFSYAFKNFKWNPTLWTRAKEIQEEKIKEIQSYESYEIDNLLRVTIGKNWISDISLFYTKELNHMIFSGKKSISIRSEYNMMEFYDELKNLNIEGGGHKNAGGLSFTGDSMEIVELFYSFLKRKQKEAKETNEIK